MRSPFVARILALAEGEAPTFTVGDDHQERSIGALWQGALGARAVLVRGDTSLGGRRVVILLPPGPGWIEAFVGVLAAGGVAVPVSPLYPASELGWFADDAGADTVILGEPHAERGAAMVSGRRVLTPQDLEAGIARAPSAIADIAPDDTAMLLYTSGTTGKPKGARITHANLAVQAELLRTAWGYRAGDRLLHALPLHHLHGLGISLCTSLLAGAHVRMLARFDARRVWEELARGDVSVWMAVPTMYQKLLEAFDAADATTRARWAAGARTLRLATSGSAALPVSLAGRWRDIAGAVPLERFGMTEIGVGTSNPLDAAARRPGSVGLALPTVETRIVGDDGLDDPEGPGELLIRGPSVFPAYWGREDATRDAFVAGASGQPWFRSGDVAVRDGDGYFRLLGRTSVDILKSGGYKLSALEIEETLRDNAAIAEVAVVGLPDETWGDRVIAVIVAAPGREADCDADRLRAWAKERLPDYKVPRDIVVMDCLPRNTLGKVVKPDLVKTLSRMLDKE